MISMKKWMELVNYRITEGADYCWDCFGYNAYTLDAWDGDNDNGWSLCITFDTKTQEVYQVEAHDYKNRRAYRLTNPDFREAYNKEAEGCPDCYEYDVHDLEVDDDWETKAFSIVNYADYDTGILVPLDFTDEELLPIFKSAHEANMTFNDYVCMALRNYLDHLKATGQVPADLGKKCGNDCKGCEC